MVTLIYIIIGVLVLALLVSGVSMVVYMVSGQYRADRANAEVEERLSFQGRN